MGHAFQAIKPDRFSQGQNTNCWPISEVGTYILDICLLFGIHLLEDLSKCDFSLYTFMSQRMVVRSVECRFHIYVCNG